ncbi:hypothetical protein COV23_00750 [Candidatus Wolfebacteria bacterium CG10_big_fil_rev_8_21_14_0_10_31_9]|uniref:HIT domain-containing protein n=1 Tax=Candidatus Wolfebacteria bacterium CG10_big_fil_rev_8_21_14_0_10_31_9 TaxID=1975070 RepID=A0A2H0RCL1_9BACT|nr:MAG: hypothetical protein COV23_00750 [Candidatus Wolfebacteria bacterium CG10_big_fil_rev_8_21_14_0_10_31_9]
MINKEIFAEIVYEDKDTIAILDVHPRALGHIMIIPKVHAETILDLPDEKVEGVFKAVKKVTSIIEKALSVNDFTIGINHGNVSGQIVKHLHIHIIPRWENDGGGSIHSVVDNPPKESIKETADKIRSIKY